MPEDLFREQFEFSRRRYLENVDFINWFRYFHIIKDVLRLSPSDILEVGSGDGLVRSCLAPLVDRYAVLDVNPKLKPDFVADLRSPVPELRGRFDCAIAADVLEHLPFADLETCLRNLASYLKEDGRALVTIPHRRSHFLLMTPANKPRVFTVPTGFLSPGAFYRRFIKRKIWIDPCHCWEIGAGAVRRSDVEEIFRRAGFRLERRRKLIYVDYWVLIREISPSGGSEPGLPRIAVGRGYAPIRQLYRRVRAILETRVLGTLLQEWIWRTRHIYKGRRWAHEYLATAGAPHREQIVQAIAKFSPVGSLLEIGCNAGANLLAASRRFPEARILGVDINRFAVKVGREHFRKSGLTNVEIRVGRADRLGFISDGSMDVVFTDATLMFVGPDKIGDVMGHIRRIARKGLVFNEYHLPAASGGSLYEGGRWVHDYERLLREFFPGARIGVEKSLKAGGEWDKYGSLVIAELRPSSTP